MKEKHHINGQVEQYHQNCTTNKLKSGFGIRQYQSGTIYLRLTTKGSTIWLV